MTHLKLHRLLSGRTLFDVARDAKIDVAVLSLVERERLEPSERVINKLEKYFKRDISDLLESVDPAKLQVAS